MSLIELMIAISLLAIFFGGVFQTVVVGLRLTALGDDHSRLQQQLAATLDRLTREVMVAEDVDAAEDDRFQFDTPAVNNVEYDYDSAAGTLTRDDPASAPVVVLRNITSLDFNYVDSAGSTLTTPVGESSEDTIRVAQVTVTLTKASTTLSMTSAAYIRNL